MTQSGRMFIAIVLTYGLRKLGFWYFQFDPIRDLPAYAGIAADIVLWLLLCYALERLIRKIANPLPAD
ncbi:MAG: hypothetical protein WCT99_04310 [Bacteroidota bacterium]